MLWKFAFCKPGRKVLSLNKMDFLLCYSQDGNIEPATFFDNLSEVTTRSGNSFHSANIAISPLFVQTYKNGYPLSRLFDRTYEKRGEGEGCYQ
jgi:hypothetical protein